VSTTDDTEIAQVRSPLSRGTIIDAARVIISDGGLDALSLRRLAASLGVTAPALYAHVDGKGDVLRSIASTGFVELVARYQEVDVADPIGRLRALARIYVDQALAQPAIFRLMFLYRPAEISVADLDNELAAATEAFEIPLQSVVEATDAGLIDLSRDPLMVALTLWTVAHGAATVLLLGMSFDDATRDQLIDSVIDATLHGLSAPAPG